MRFIILPTLILMLAASHAAAQTSSLYKRPLPGGPSGPTLESGSWTYIPPPPRKEIDLQTIISIRVDVLSEMESEGNVERRKNGLYNAVLNDWIRLAGIDAIKPAPQSDGDPTIDGQLNERMRSESELETSESLTFDIAARVVDIRPNGNLVLEAHRDIRINEEKWEYALMGECRPEDLGPGNLVLSRDIADLHIEKRERGAVRDSYRRGWFTKWFDGVNPF